MRGRARQVVVGLAVSIGYKSSIITCQFVAMVFHSSLAVSARKLLRFFRLMTARVRLDIVVSGKVIRKNKDDAVEVAQRV